VRAWWVVETGSDEYASDIVYASHFFVGIAQGGQKYLVHLTEPRRLANS
jgi:hypothetical protein